MFLNFHNAFGFPFHTQPFGFFALALGAISLLTIKTVVLVPLGAMSLLGIDVCSRCRVSLGVVRRGHRVQVLRIDAIAVSASVIDYESIGYLSSGQPQRNAVSTAAGPAECQVAISIPIFVPIPNDAMSRARALFIESLYFFSGWASHVLSFQLASEV